MDIGDAANPIRLHLTDGRSYKTAGGRDAVLGAAQMQALASSIENAPAQAVHLIASGVPFEWRSGETWRSCPAEHAKVLALAADHRILILSGDAHENRLPAPRPAGNWSLFEATSSGAALRKAINAGELQCNWGLVEITPHTVRIELSQRHTPPLTRVIDRQSWQLRPAA